jgi:hypothetical protein
VFLNILLLEVYVNLSAIPAAEKKTWRTTINAHRSLPPPAVVLSQDTFFINRAILASNNHQLVEFNKKLVTNNTLKNQRGFTDFTSFPTTHFGGDVNYVSFNGTYHNLNIGQDLFLEYMFYCKLSISSRSGARTILKARRQFELSR